jgi:Protein of unknown function (DUF3631)
MTDLAVLLDDVAALVRRYVVVTVKQAHATALYIACTHAFDAFDVFPYFAVMSPEKRSGKTRMLDVLALLVARPWRTIEPSEAVVYRKIDQDTPTLLLDEVDAIFGRKRETTEGLRALLNAGNARGTRVPRCVGPQQKLTEFDVYCPKVLAGIGHLPETVADRAIPITMQRKTRAERCERFRARRVHEHTEPLRERLADWADIDGGYLPVLVEEVAALADDAAALAALDDRAFEAWEPLLAVAALADGPWPARAVAAALALSADRDEDPETYRLRLLRDVRDVFDRLAVDRLSSHDLAAELAADADAPWSDWHGKAITQRSVADLLRPFKIKPKSVRLDDERTPKGYHRDQFADAWKRYAAVPPGSAPPHPPQRLNDAGSSALFDPPQDGRVADAEIAGNRHGYADVADVADKNAGNGPGRRCGHSAQWLARDGSWRCATCDAPAFVREVVAMRTRDADDTGLPAA